MKPSSKRQQSGEKQRESTTGGWLRPLAVLGLVAVLVAAPVAAITGGGSSSQAATDDGLGPAQERTPTMTAVASGSASGSGSASSSVAVSESGHEVRQQEDVDPDPRSIELGSSTGGAIDEDDPQSEEYRGYHDPITFEGEAGQAVSISMDARNRYGPEPVYHGRETAVGDDGGQSGSADPYLILVGPNGNVIARSDDTDHSLNARVQGVVLPESGEYTVVATSYNESQTFDYHLSTSVEDAESAGDNLRSIDLNSSAVGEIDKADPYDRDRRGFYEPVTFDGSAGQTVRVEMGSRPGDTYLMLLDPSGEVIAENDDHRSLNSTIERVTLPEDGEYTIVATSFSREDRFVYELSVDVVGAVTPGGGGENLRDIRIGETASGEIDAGDPSAPFLRGNYEPVSFEGRAGQSVTIDMTSDRGDTYLMVYGPEGDRIASNDDYEGLNSHVEIELPESGEYTIIATSFGREDTFSYELSVSEGGSAPGANATDLRSIAYGETRDGTIDEDDPESRIYRGYYEPVTFNGSAGDEVSIDMTSEDDTYLILLAPNGTVVQTNDDFRGLDSHIEAELATDGQYTIIATSYDERATFDYQLTLERTDASQS